MRNAGTARGDGLLMARAAGAKVIETGAFYGHVQSANALDNSRLWPYPTLDQLIGAGLLLAADGKRFADEGRGGVFVANAIAQQQDPLSTLAIFDRAIWEGRARDFPLPANPLLAKAGAKAYQAGSLEAFATAAKVPPTNLMQTIAEYNAAVLSNNTMHLSPPRSIHLQRPIPITVPPFFAVPAVAGITYTMGGIAIDGDARVKGRYGGVIKGLFAAGSATGGHEGGPFIGYTGGLSKALTFGWCAARAIAREHGSVAGLKTIQQNQPASSP